MYIIHLYFRKAWFVYDIHIYVHIIMSKALLIKNTFNVGTKANADKAVANILREEARRDRCPGLIGAALVCRRYELNL